MTIADWEKAMRSFEQLYMITPSSVLDPTKVFYIGTFSLYSLKI